MRTRLLLFFLLTATKFFGQIGFHENIVVGPSYTTRWPQLVRAADFDGDNDLDVISYGTSLNWYQNVDGLGNFGQKNLIGSPTGATGIVLEIADFDNDGDPDILSALQNKLVTYKNTAGSFQMVQTITAGINSSNQLSAVPVDMDVDGDLDILCVYHGSSGVSLVWYQNDGTGTMAAEQIISNSGDLIGATTLLTKDLDGDNDQDIIVGNKSYGKIGWIKNLGNLTFSAHVTISTSAGGLTSIAASDLDGDGDMDIVSASEYDNQVVCYKNLNGLGNFSDENVITSNATASNAVLVAQMDNGNTVDLLYTGTNEIGWMSNDGSGNFGAPQMITNQAFNVRDVIMADLDGDGKKDLISASNDDDKVAWYKNIDGNGSFGRQLPIGRSVEFPNNVYPGDFDGDGDIDLLANSQHDAKLAWYENVNGLGFYGKQHIITENVQVGNQTPVSYPLDVDGDGDLDIATRKGTVLLWYENDGQGNFTEHVIDDTSGGTTLIRSGDMDGDGHKDLVCVAYSDGILSWYKNLGNGTFGLEQVITDMNLTLTSLEIADMDGDNDLDIIASTYDWDTYLFKNTNGLGNFAQQSSTAFDEMQAVYPADIDGDGDMDIVGVAHLGGTFPPTVGWFENTDGLGDFTIMHDIYTGSARGLSVHAADIDNDGDMDVFAGSGLQATGQLAWFENTGGGVFSPRKIMRETSDYTTASCVATADVDNDNDLDVLAVFGYNANGTIGSVSVFENLGVLGNTIQGKVLIDTDSNGCSSADVKGRNLMVISDNGTNSFATFTDQYGMYQVATTAGNFTTAITSQLPDYFVSTPASHTFSFTGMNNTQAADFCVAPAGAINDLDVSVYPVQGAPRPGFPTYYRIVYRNIGTITSTGTVNFEYNNNKMAFLTASQAVSSQTANTLAFDFTNLQPLETRTIDLHFSVFGLPLTIINDHIISNATINPVSGDETEANNSFTLDQTVISSYDPNDIRCLEGTQVLIQDADKYLHYIIRFQNTGTASAINVKVENILDSKLDWTSMQLESMSHNGRVEINDGNAVKFIFNNINLPDSTTNEPQSHGFIAYKIKPLDNVAVGDIVHSTADIYFDFNPAVVTNTAATQFVSVLAVPENRADAFSISPNPTTGLLNIQGSMNIDEVFLMDVNGRILKDIDFDHSTAIQIDLTDLSAGIYFLKIKSGSGYTSRKVIKK